MRHPMVLGWAGLLLVLTACGLESWGARRVCFAGTDGQTTDWSALVRLTFQAHGRVTGDSYGSLYQPETSYAADYRQTVTGSVQGTQLQLNVTTRLRASREDVEGYPPQTQETWRFEEQQVTPIIRKLPLKKTDCRAINGSLQRGGRWFQPEAR